MKGRTGILFIALIVALAAGCKKEQKEIAREGLVNFLSGEVYLIKGTVKTQAKVGDVVSQGMKVETGKKAFVDIYFGENAIKILENTVIEIKKLITNPKMNTEESELYLEKGKAFSKITQKLSKGDRYSVSTPTTVAAIRGTDFMVEESKGKGKVSCIDGKVAVRDGTVENSEFVEVKAGEEVEVEPGKPLSVKELSEMNRQNIQKIKEDIRKMQEDIRRRFEEEREKIREAVRVQKDKNREMLDKQKAMDKANIEAIKGDMKGKKEEIKEGVDNQKEAIKEGLDAQKDANKGVMDSVKPDVKKFSSDGNSLKPNMNVKPDLNK